MTSQILTAYPSAGQAGLRPTSEAKLYGLLTPGELVRGAMGAGLGYAGG